MPSPEVLDFARLLAPIPGDRPAGTDLRADTSPVSDYYAVRDARKAASDSERRIDKGDESAEPPEWRPVRERALKVLGEKTKDLEVTAYLIESLVRLEGFPGLRDGYRLARELIEKFWDGLYPSAEGDIEDRFSHILYLNGIDAPGTLIVPVRKVPLTTATSLGEFNLTDYQQAQTLSKIADPKIQQKRIEEGAVTLETIKKAVAETPAKFYADMVENIAKCQEEFRRFCAALSEKSGYDPPSSDLLGALDSYLEIVKDLARDKLAAVKVEAPGVPAAAAVAGQPIPVAQQAVDPGVIKNRADALDRLKKVAEYFREHEPQSILPYALEQIVTWGKMSLPELLSELLEEGPRKSLFKQVGIKPPETKK